MSDMFEGCTNFTSLDVSNFNPNVTDMSYMFDGCSNLSRLSFGSNFKVSSSSSYVFPTPTKTYSGKPSTGQWGLGSEQADSSKTAKELEEYGTTLGALNGTWYAQAKTYTIVFDGNGATSGSTASESMVYDTAKTLTVNGFARKGYTFAGWNTKADGTGTSYTDGQSVNNLAASGTVTLYAQWQANTYTVSIPKAVKYEGMSIGNVNVGTSYDITVKCKTGKFADRIEVSSSASPMTAAGGSNDLSASSDSSKTPLVFNAEGTQQDHVTISGTTTTADKWAGSIQYTVSEK